MTLDADLICMQNGDQLFNRCDENLAMGAKNRCIHFTLDIGHHDPVVTLDKYSSLVKF